MNVVILHGRLTKDIELQNSENTGKSYIRFSIAVNREFSKNKEADFINCLAFDKTAETIAKFFSKGKPILLRGRLQIDSKETPEGKKNYTTIIVDSFDFVSSNEKKETADETHPIPKNTSQAKKAISFDDPNDDIPDDFPF